MLIPTDEIVNKELFVKMAMLVTADENPNNVCIKFPELVSHILTVKSYEPLTKFPFESVVKAEIGPVCPIKIYIKSINKHIFFRS